MLTIEQAIGQALAADPGYRGPVKTGDAPDAYHDFDPDVGLDLPEMVAFLEETQPQAWGRVVESFPSKEAACEGVGERLTGELDRRGVLDVVDNGFTFAVGGDTGDVRLDLARSGPARPGDAVPANRFTATSGLRYDPRSTRTVGLGLFVNGILVATAELRGSGSADEAMDTYRRYRDPAIPAMGRAVAHFAVGSERVLVATRLEGAATRFVPFGPVGRPVSIEGPATEFLWSEIWRSDAWLGHLARFASIGNGPTEG